MANALTYVVLDRLRSTEGVRFLDRGLFYRLTSILLRVEDFIDDAERKQFNDPSVKKWLDDLKHALYVADDLLDRVFIFNRKVSRTHFLVRFLDVTNSDLISEMEGITTRLEKIAANTNKFKLEPTEREDFFRRTTSRPLFQGYMSDVYGRDEDKKKILELLLVDNTDDNISVIPIVGRDGIGKTTLAQWLYNDDNLMDKFDLKAWVRVSEKFDVVNIMKSVTEAVTSAACDVEDLNLLQLDLKENLAGKKFFLVLDDVLNFDFQGWNSFKRLFQYVIKGSRIIVTTPSIEVASYVQTLESYFLDPLSDKYCWSLFAKHADLPKSGGTSDLEEIGWQIVRERCNGLPLVAKMLGALLRINHDIRAWKAVLRSEVWAWTIKDSEIISALKVSYYYLPTRLKGCFAYCSLFPKDYKFNKDELILLWMSEGLLGRPLLRTLEEVGSEFFDDLVCRSFFKKLRDDDESFVMHDLIHDLAIFVAGDFYLRSEELGKTNNIKIQTRHLSFGRLSYPIQNNGDAIDNLKSLRTFLPINFTPPSFSFKNVAFILSKLKHLRVLSFNNFQELDVLPESIGELVHLLYLDLSCTNIKTLPECLSKLYNLQTLKLYWCQKLTELPSGMQNLVNLQHLDIRGTQLKEMPRGMSKLKKLQLLSYFVSKPEENGTKKLGELSNIHGSLWLGNLENVSNSDEAEAARIKDKTHIKDLTFEWSADSGDMVTTSNVEEEILDKLQPHKGLERLKVVRYRGTRFSDWVGHSSYHNMTLVILDSCSNCYVLPSLGQLPYLKSLEIANFNTMESIGDELYKIDNDVSSSRTPFPSIEKLIFRGMSCWRVWHSSESHAFPKLKYLEISDCPRLKGDLPHHLPALETLEVGNCPRLKDLPVHIPALKTLVINECRQLSSLPHARSIRELRISSSNRMLVQKFPNSLKSLLIKGCLLVEHFLGIICNTQPTCLQSLDISDCACSLSIPGHHLPKSLKELRIQNCRNLEFAATQCMWLESLEIHDSCDFLTFFPLNTFPNLKHLVIKGCLHLETLMPPLQLEDSTLDSVTISCCPNFVNFPRFAAPNLTSFRLIQCPMMSLPSDMNILLPKLEFLSIWDCPTLDMDLVISLPPNLQTLYIMNDKYLLRHLSLMGMHEGITFLSIGSISMSVSSFPKVGLLPHFPSLATLVLYGFEYMEALDCDGLLHLTSLIALQIGNCPKLKSVKGERLPSSLLKLEIYATPFLEELCNEKHPHIWSKISHIPSIRVNERWVS